MKKFLIHYWENVLSIIVLLITGSIITFLNISSKDLSKIVKNLSIYCIVLTILMLVRCLINIINDATTKITCPIDNDTKRLTLRETTENTFRELIKDCKELLITGGSLPRIKYLLDVIDTNVSPDCKITMILVAPRSRASKTMALRIATRNLPATAKLAQKLNVCRAYDKAIEATLTTLIGYKEQKEKKSTKNKKITVNIKTIKFLPQGSYIYTKYGKINRLDAIKFELYSFQCSSKNRRSAPYFYGNEDFEHFYKQMQYIIRNSTPYTGS